MWKTGLGELEVCSAELLNAMWGWWLCQLVSGGVMRGEFLHFCKEKYNLWCCWKVMLSRGLSILEH